MVGTRVRSVPHERAITIAAWLITENLIVGSVFLDDENDVLEWRMRWTRSRLVPLIIASNTPAVLREIGA